MKNVAFILLFLIIPIWFFSNAKENNWKEGHAGHIIRSVDAKGYYAYLPAIFIYKDLSFEFWREPEKKYWGKLNPYNAYRQKVEDSEAGCCVNKYYAGTAVLQLPFFLTGHAITKAKKGDADGYSYYYQVLINIGTICYLFIGLLFFNRFLKSNQINRWKRLITLYVTAFGTNIAVYSLDDPSMSHIYSFAAVSLFMVLSDKFFRQNSMKTLLLAATIFGLIVLIRPINGLVIFSLPFLAGTSEKLIKGFDFIKNKPISLLFSALLFFAVVGIQLILYKIQTGHFIVYSYQDEGFDFLDPNILNILFSYKKGLFVYTPLAGIAMIGLFFMKRYRGLALGSFLLFLTYVLSCWHPWWYGGSFSSRVYVEYFPFIFFAFAVLLSKMKKKIILISFLAGTLFLTLHNQQQIILYRWGVIHWDSMTKEKYWEASFKAGDMVRGGIKKTLKGG
ncbi:MAG: hypothetical protein ACI85O_003425 [Saprospiraceae bacterium]|jgi:hypothetical protein